MPFLSLFMGSFHSAETYRQVRAAGKFFMGYACIVVVLCTLAFTIFFAHFIHREVFVPRGTQPALFDDIVKQIARQLPVMTLQDNQLMSNSSAPTVISVSGVAFGQGFTNLDIITIDTRGQTTHENMKTPVLVNTKEIIFKSDRETKIKSIADLLNNKPTTMVINQAMAESLSDMVITSVRDSLTSIYLIIGTIGWFFIAAYMFVMRMFMLLALGVAGLVIGSVVKSPINYASAVGLAAVSYTPIAILDTVLFAAFQFPTSRLILFVAGCVALFAAIKCSHTPPPRQLVG
jgi:hypothetical protein